MAECSFGKMSLKGTFEPWWGFHTDLYMRAFYMRSGSEQLLICAFDTLGTWASDARKFRTAVSEECGIPEKSIIFHELQIHASLGCTEMHASMNAIIEKAVDEIKKIKASAVPFECEVTEAYFGRECSFNREQYVEGLGGVTVWTGMRFDENGRPYTDDEGVMLLLDYRPGLESVKQRIYFDNANDPLAYLFVFRDAGGNVIGSISRFAAHPDVAVLFEHRPVQGIKDMYHFDFDWPGYLSEKLENDLGGTSMYINGPCADLTSKKGYDGINDFYDSDRECRRLGELFADKLIVSYKKRADKINCGDLKTDTFKVRVPMRTDMPLTVKAAHDERDALIKKAREEYERSKTDGSSPSEVKRKIDDLWKAMYNGPMVYDICGFDDKTLAERQVEIDIPVVSFGGYLFVGVPGESLVETSLALRSSLTGSRTVTVDQCDGYYSYMATPRTLRLGGYTYWCSWTTSETFPSMIEQITEKIKKFNGDA